MNVAASKREFSSTDHTQPYAKIFDLIAEEKRRQSDGIELIASENIVSRNVRLAQASVLTNKYAEGYSGRRYYGGCHVVDKVEDLAVDLAKQLFQCNFANVQPHSGSQANAAVFLALIEPGDTILGLNLNAGGHLTHGAPVNISGKWFNVLSYGVDRRSHRIDMEEVRALARKHRPKLIIAGGSAYPRAMDFAAFRAIADDVGAYLMVDMAHVAGLVAAGVHESPLPHAHVVSSTTHKTLRGPRGGLLLSNDEVIARKINSAIFPGMQGGPLMHVIASKAVAFEEALGNDFRSYAEAVIQNANVFASALAEDNFDLVSGGTDTHLLLLDLRSKGITGIDFENALGRIGISCNKNSVPDDDKKPIVTSGVRFGTPATTTRGLGLDEFREIASLINETAISMVTFGPGGNVDQEIDMTERVSRIVARFPMSQLEDIK